MIISLVDYLLKGKGSLEKLLVESVATIKFSFSDSNVDFVVIHWIQKY